LGIIQNKLKEGLYMKTAVVFYSYSGNSSFVAQQIKSSLNADLVQLNLMKEKKRGKFASILWGGFMVMSGKKPPLKPYNFDPSAYELIILGTPVWAGSPSPPIKTFLSQTPITGKKLALYVCHAGGAGDSLEKFKALVPGNEIVSTADFLEPRKSKEEVKQQIADWAGKI
jgi:flavodoxin